MSIEAELKKDGIEVTQKLDAITINEIAKKVAHKINTAFPNYGLSESDIYSKIVMLDMYKAKMQERYE